MRIAELSAASSSSRLMIVLASLTMFVMGSLSAFVMVSSVRGVKSTVYIISVAGMMDWNVRRIRLSILGLDSFE